MRVQRFAFQSRFDFSLSSIPNGFVFYMALGEWHFCANRKGMEQNERMENGRKEKFRGGGACAFRMRFAAFEMGGPNQIDCIRAGGKENNG